MARIFLGIPIPNLSPRCFLYISVFLGTAILNIAWLTLPHYSVNRNPFLSDFQPPFNVFLPKHEDVDFISGTLHQLHLAATITRKLNGMRIRTTWLIFYRLTKKWKANSRCICTEMMSSTSTTSFPSPPLILIASHGSTETRATSSVISIRAPSSLLILSRLSSSLFQFAPI